MSSASEPLLVCQGLSKSFNEGALKVDVFKNINFSVAENEMIAIIGASGQGKSTLLHLMGGLDVPDEGEVLLRGQSFKGCSESKKSIMRNQHLGFIYQFHHLLPEYNALENVMMPLLIRKTRNAVAKKAALALLDRVGLLARQQHRIAELSGGERQRVAIARALVTQPACVLADEPTGNLDHQSADVIFELMRELKQDFKTSFVVVTHNEELAQRLDKTFILKQGVLQLPAH